MVLVAVLVPARGSLHNRLLQGLGQCHNNSNSSKVLVAGTGPPTARVLDKAPLDSSAVAQVTVRAKRQTTSHQDPMVAAVRI